MKKVINTFLFLFLMLPGFVGAFEVPAKPNTYVNDYAGLLSSEQKEQLEQKIRAFEQSSTNEIAVVTIQLLNGEEIADVAQQIFTAWGIGKADKNSGVLLLISLSDRKTRIQTGYGVEGSLTDLGTSYIQSDLITPAFRAGDYTKGINDAVDAMIAALSGNNVVPENYTTEEKKGLPWDFWIIIVFIVIQWLGAILGKSKSWWHGGVLGGVVAMGVWYFFISSAILAVPLVIFSVIVGLIFDFIVSRAYANHLASGTRLPWFLGGGGGSGFGGRGGGFGGFGGGSSVGGGSSGSW